MDKKHILGGIVVLYLLGTCNLSVSAASYYLNGGETGCLFVAVREEGDIIMNLITPEGTLITAESAKDYPNIDYTENELYTYYTVLEPEKGMWKTIISLYNASKEKQNVKEYYTFLDVARVQYWISVGRHDYSAGDGIEMNVKIEGIDITDTNLTLIIERPDGTNDSLEFFNVSASKFKTYYNNTDIEGTYWINTAIHGFVQGDEFKRGGRHTYFIIQKYPDFKVNSSDIVFSNTSLRTGETFPFNVSISNIGTVSGNVTVGIYYGWEAIDNISIFLDNGTNTTISTQLKVKNLEYQEIIIILKQFPPCLHRCEDNIGNNFAKKSLNVERSIYQQIKDFLNILQFNSPNALISALPVLFLIFGFLIVINNYKKQITFKKIAIGFFAIMVLITLWQLGIFSGGPGGTGIHPNPCGGYYGFGRIKPMEPSLQLSYDGTFSVSMMNGLGMPMNLTHLEVRYEGERHSEDIAGKRCIIQQPVAGSNFGAGEVFRLIAYCPPINKNLEHASIYLTLGYEYIINNNNISRTELGNLCLSNDGDEFS